MRCNTPSVKILYHALCDCLNKHHCGNHIAVACSGGSDSLALTLIAKKYCDSNNITLTVLIVDHALRDGSDKEALYCANILQQYHINYQILTADGQYQGNLQKWARDQRYQMMANICQQKNIPSLLVAHHQNDMAENFLMNIKRHSDIRGLSSLRMVVDYNENLKIIRPFLDQPKQILSDVLHDEAISPIQDPSNDNDAFLRVKMRQTLTKIKAFDNADIAHICHHLRAYDDATQMMVAKIAEPYIHHHQYYIMLDWQSLTTHIPSLLLGRFLGDYFCHISGKEYPPKRVAINHIMNKIDDVVNGQYAHCYGQLYHCHYHYRQSYFWLVSCRHKDQISQYYPSKKQFILKLGAKAKKLCDDMPWQVIKYLPVSHL